MAGKSASMPSSRPSMTGQDAQGKRLLAKRDSHANEPVDSISMVDRNYQKEQAGFIPRRKSSMQRGSVFRPRRTSGVFPTDTERKCSHISHGSGSSGGRDSPVTALNRDSPPPTRRYTVHLSSLPGEPRKLSLAVSRSGSLKSTVDGSQAIEEAADRHTKARHEKSRSFLRELSRGHIALTSFAGAGRGIFVNSMRDSVLARGEIEVVEVPQQLIDVLAHNMPRFLQLVERWSDKTGTINAVGFERLLYTLGVRNATQSNTHKLFHVIDTDQSGRITLSEFLVLKFAIDNEITALPGHGVSGSTHERSTQAERSTMTMMMLASSQDLDAKLVDFGFSRLVKPVLGAVWKGVVRPHHALDMPQDARASSLARTTAVHAHLLTDSSSRVHLALRVHAKAEVEHERYTYKAGPVGSSTVFCEEMHQSLCEAASRACAEQGALLNELRQMDLKLQEITLHQMAEFLPEHGGKQSLEARAEYKSAREQAWYMREVLRSFARDAEASLISMTRYRDDGPSRVPPQLIGMPRAGILPIDQVLARDKSRDVFYFNVLAGSATTLLVLTLVTQCAVFIGVGRRGTAQSWYDNHDVCEFQKTACRDRPWQYTCFANGTIVLLDAVVNGRNLPPIEWGEPFLDKVCDPVIQARSWMFSLPLPLLFLAAVVLPIGLFRGNAHFTTIKKCVLWTPTVPLSFLQCLIRASILLSVYEDAADKTYAAIAAVEALMLVMQVSIFVLMDAMRRPTPLLRIGFALVLILRFGFSLTSRSLSHQGAEQLPLFKPGYWRDLFMGFGSNSKQATITSLDWTIVFMLFSSIVSVINYPNEMAVVRLRCDTKDYFNWRDQYIGAMHVRAHRRDLSVADRYLQLRSVFQQWRGRLAQRPVRQPDESSESGAPVAEGLHRGLSSLSSMSYLKRAGGLFGRTQKVDSSTPSVIEGMEEGTPRTECPPLAAHAEEGEVEVEDAVDADDVDALASGPSLRVSKRAPAAKYPLTTGSV